MLLEWLVGGASSRILHATCPCLLCSRTLKRRLTDATILEVRLDPINKVIATAHHHRIVAHLNISVVRSVIFLYFLEDFNF